MFTYKVLLKRPCEADNVFYTLAGPEISVATTKAYSAQLVAMYCLAVQLLGYYVSVARQRHAERGRKDHRYNARTNSR